MDQFFLPYDQLAQIGFFRFVLDLPANINCQHNLFLMQSPLNLWETCGFQRKNYLISYPWLVVSCLVVKNKRSMWVTLRTREGLSKFRLRSVMFSNGDFVLESSRVLTMESRGVSIQLNLTHPHRGASALPYIDCKPVFTKIYWWCFWREGSRRYLLLRSSSHWRDWCEGRRSSSGTMISFSICRFCQDWGVGLSLLL